MSAPDVLTMVRAGIDTADAMYAHAYGQRLPLATWTPPVDARVTALHDAIQAAKAAGLIGLATGERADGARSWWVSVDMIAVGAEETKDHAADAAEGDE